MEHPLSKRNFPLMLLALLSLLGALWAGIFRLGWSVPALLDTLPIAHGPLMVSGFLGTVISLERVVALKKRWMYSAPLLTGLGGLGTLLGAPASIGPWLILLGSLSTLAIFSAILKREMKSHTLTMGVGSLAWVIGNVLWLAGQPLFQVVLWWMTFLVLTIAGERLELSRVTRLEKRQYAFFITACAILIIGNVLFPFAYQWGSRLSGLGLLMLAGWMLRFDIARRTMRHENPLTRYIGRCLFSGYLWLGIGGAVSLISGALTAGPRYDLMLHAVFLGFVFSMIFGHAPIILPGVLGVPITFTPIFYLHFGLLHISLVLRSLGDLLPFPAGRLWGGLLNAITLLLFLAVTAITVRRSIQK